MDEAIANELGVDRRALGKAIEKIKQSLINKGSDNVTISRVNGDVWDQKSGEYIGNVFDEIADVK